LFPGRDLGRVAAVFLTVVIMALKVLFEGVKRLLTMPKYFLFLQN
jgi:hypothetical protein